MIEFIKAVFQIYPLTMWISLAGMGFIFFGGRHWASIGFWMIGGVAVFMLLIYMTIEEMEDWRRNKNRGE